METSRVLTYAAPEPQQFSWMPRVLLAFAWVYPLAPLGALCLTWFVAWIALGHQPRPSIDDPKSISALVDVPYLATALLLVTMPIGMVLYWYMD